MYNEYNHIYLCNKSLLPIFSLLTMFEIAKIVVTKFFVPLKNSLFDKNDLTNVTNVKPYDFQLNLYVILRRQKRDFL